MRAKKNTITINGRTYDATTGKALDMATTPAKAVVSTKKIKVTNYEDKKQTVFVKRSSATTPARKIERSKTLMRNTVKRPSTPVVTHSVAGLTAQPKTIIVKSGKQITRDKTLHTHTKSPQITKFGLSSSVHTTKTAHIPVASAPTTKTTHNYDISNTPPAPRIHPGSKPLRESHKDLFETALQGANSHKAKRLRRPKAKHRILRLGASALTVMLLVAFFGYQNMPAFALKRASSTIGFNASIPGYKPAGFRLNGPVTYGPGNVSLTFRSNSDSQSYQLTQQKTDMDEQALTQSVLQGQDYQKVSANGQPGYIYDGNNITWINGGVWYNLTGDASLSEKQLVNIASSL